MPIYEYLCEECGRISELMQKMSDPPLRKCPECSSKKIAKLVSRTAFQLKGGGWYADLYSSAKKDSKGSTAPPGAGATDKATATSTEPSTGTKPSSAPEKKTATPKSTAGPSKS